MLRAFYRQLDTAAGCAERWTAGRAWLCLAVGLLVALICGLGLTKIGFVNDYRVFFETDNIHRASHEQLDAEFARSDTLNFVVAATKGDMLDRRHLAALESLTQEAWSLPFALRAESLTNYQYSRAEGDDLAVAPLVEGALGLTEQARQDIAQIALSDRAIQGRFLSADGRTAQVIVTIDLPPADSKALGEIAAATQALKDSYAQAYPELTVATTGVPLLSHSFYAVTQSDMLRLVPVMVVLLLLAIAWFFRSWAAALVTLATLGLAVITTMGLAGWLGFALSPATAQVPVIILTIATAEAIHLIGVAYALQGEGKPRLEAIARSVRDNHAPIALTTLTDILGFLCFNFSETPPFRDLGNMAAMGAAIAYLFAMFFLPALLRVAPLRVSSSLSAKEHNIAALARWCMAHRKAVMLGFAALTIGLGSLAPRLETRDNFIEWLSEGHPFRTDAQFISARLPGIYTLNYGLPAPDGAGGIADPAYLRHLAALSGWLEAQPEVADVFSLVDVMRRLNRNMHGDDPARDVLPEGREEAAQYLLLYELSLAQGMDLSNQINLDKSASRLVVALKDITSEQMVDLKLRADAWIVANLPAQMHSTGSGTALMFAFLTQDNTRAMASGTMMSLALIGVFTGLALLSLRLGLLSLVPAITPVVMAFGAWALIEGAQGLYAAFVVSCALGLVVDSVTHFMMRFAAQRRIHSSADDVDLDGAVLATFRSVGMELWIASSVLAIGFFILTFSDFAVIAKLGAMVTLIFCFAIATTFLLTPALMRSFGGPGRGRQGGLRMQGFDRHLRPPAGGRLPGRAGLQADEGPAVPAVGRQPAE